VRCREAGIADEVGVAPKGQLAQQMLTRAFASGVPADWGVGATVYGYDELRRFLEDQQKHDGVAVPATHRVWVAGQPQLVGFVAALVPAAAWVVLSAGEGSQGPRRYAWAWLQLPTPPEATAERTRWILMRRRRSDPSTRAYDRVAGPATLQLADLVRIAGSRWNIAVGCEAAKGEVGLDHYEVRGFRAWYRHSTVVLVAHALLVVLRAQANAPETNPPTTLRACS
jgi:SRSO17 transposase